MWLSLMIFLARPESTSWNRNLKFFRSSSCGKLRWRTRHAKRSDTWDLMMARNTPIQFHKFYEEHGIQRHFSVRKIPQHNVLYRGWISPLLKGPGVWGCKLAFLKAFGQKRWIWHAIYSIDHHDHHYMRKLQRKFRQVTLLILII